MYTWYCRRLYYRLYLVVTPLPRLPCLSRIKQQQQQQQHPSSFRPGTSGLPAFPPGIELDHFDPWTTCTENCSYRTPPFNNLIQGTTTRVAHCSVVGMATTIECNTLTVTCNNIPCNS